MPYKSEAQRKFFNSPAGKEKLGEEEVEHWNEVSKGMKLPEKAVDKAIRLCDELNVYEIIYSSKKDSPRSLAYVSGGSENEALTNLKKKYSVAVVHSIKKTSKNSREYKQVMAMASGNNKFD